MKRRPVDHEIARSANVAEQRTPKGEALNDLILTLFRVNGRLNKAGDALCSDLDLTSARWQVLGAITDQPRTVAQIARQYELTRQGVLWVVQAMVKDGLVELVRNPDHRRAKLVRQTSLGFALYEEISRRQRYWVSELAVPFSATELKAAADLLRRFAEVIVADEEEGG
ncbi:MAG: MarR family transcriptional regulator [Steroidobacteraceae bacterium]